MPPAMQMLAIVVSASSLTLMIWALERALEEWKK